MTSTEHGERTSYLYLDHGEGGIFTLPTVGVSEDSFAQFLSISAIGTNQLRYTNAIGTTDALTCVCVYIPIDKNRCFAAHIDACLQDSDGTSGMKWWQLPEKEVKPLKAFLVKQPDLAFQKLLPELKSLRQDPERNQKAELLCPLQMASKNGTGFHIVETVCEYFGLRKEEVLNRRRAHGFVVDHLKGWENGFEYMGYSEPVPTEEVLEALIKATDEISTNPDDWDKNWRRLCGDRFARAMPKHYGWEAIRIINPKKSFPWSMLGTEEGWVSCARKKYKDITGCAPLKRCWLTYMGAIKSAGLLRLSKEAQPTRSFIMTTNVAIAQSSTLRRLRGY